ncbi:MAG: extracellular solute-binding protein [Azospirillaceae bacterium]|nr:extracellular solute-binding protein [Azospirillaceae bacterium]
MGAKRFLKRRRHVLCGTALALSLAAVLPLAARAQGGRTITEWDLQTTAGAVKVIHDAADRFEQANPGFRVEESHIANDAYKTKLKIAFGANEPPCVFATWGGGPLREYVKSGQVVDLTPYLDKDPAFRDRFLPNSFKPVTVDGKIFGLPAENTAVAVIFYNKEIFARHKLAPPTTWDELMSVVKILKADGVAPFAMANKSKWPGSMFYVYLVDRIGGPAAFSDALERHAGGGFADPAFVEAGRRIQDLVKAGGFAEGFNGLDYDIGASRRLLYSGRAAMELMGSWEVATIRNENPAFLDKLDFFAFPAVAGGKGDPRDLIGTLGDNFLSVSAQCPETSAAVNLVKTMTDDKAAQGRLDDRRMMPLKGLSVSDPLLKSINLLIGNAPNVQLWYDQELPPKLGEVHKDTTQALFGLSVTPEAAAQQMEDVAKTELR